MSVCQTRTTSERLPETYRLQKKMFIGNEAVPVDMTISTKKVSSSTLKGDLTLFDEPKHF